MPSPGGVLLFLVVYLIVNKYIPNACIVYCFAYLANWLMGRRLAQQGVYLNKNEEDQDGAKLEKPKTSDNGVKNRRSEGNMSADRPAGAPRQKQKKRWGPAVKRESCCCKALCRMFKMIRTVLNCVCFPFNWVWSRCIRLSHADKKWCLFQFFLLCYIARHSYEFGIAYYNDSRQISYGCNVGLHFWNLIIPLGISFIVVLAVFLLYGFGVLRLFDEVDEALVWPVTEPWILTFAGVVMHCFYQYVTIIAKNPMCTPAILQRELPNMFFYNNYYFNFPFDRTTDFVGQFINTYDR